jgi:hypothetical protein
LVSNRLTTGRNTPEYRDFYSKLIWKWQ